MGRFVIYWHFGAIILAVWWVLFILRRLPRDIEELKRFYRDYRGRNDPLAVGRMSEERRQLHERDAADNFWSTLGVQVFLFWPLTIAALIFIAWFVRRVIAPWVVIYQNTAGA